MSRLILKKKISKVLHKRIGISLLLILNLIVISVLNVIYILMSFQSNMYVHSRVMITISYFVKKILLKQKIYQFS